MYTYSVWQKLTIVKTSYYSQILQLANHCSLKRNATITSYIHWTIMSIMCYQNACKYFNISAWKHLLESPFSSLSRFGHQVWHLAGNQVACGLKVGFWSQIFSLTHPIYLFRPLCIGSPWLQVNTSYGPASCVHPPVPNW